MRVAVAGAGGRMGRRIAELAAESPDLKLSAVWEAPASAAIGLQVAGVVIGGDAAAAIATADVMVDFTRPAATLEHVRIAADHGVACVIGTTGFERPLAELLAPYAERIPIVAAPNMSVGVNLLLRLVRDACATLGLDYDVEIIDIHHHHKVDAPSGTAKALRDAVLAARGQDEVAVTYGRVGDVGARPHGEVGVHGLRAGDIVGDHTVLLAGPGERLELTHRAHSRDTFAHGALRAVRWLSGKPAGLYGMEHVLGWA